MAGPLLGDHAAAQTVAGDEWRAEPGWQQSPHRCRSCPAQPSCPPTGLPWNSTKGRLQRARVRFQQLEGRSAPHWPSQEDAGVTPAGFTALPCFSSEPKANQGTKLYQGVTTAYLKSYQRQRCGSGEPANDTDAQSWCSHTISIVCCGHHQTSAATRVPAITELVLTLDAHKSGWGSPLHRCCRCCTCLVTLLPTHHFSTFTHHTGMQKVRERAFLPKTIIFEWWTRMSRCAGWLAIKTPSTGGAGHPQITLASCPGPRRGARSPGHHRVHFSHLDH